MQASANTSPRDYVYATIQSARTLAELLEDIGLDFGRYRPSISAFIERLNQKVLFGPQDDSVLFDLTILARSRVISTYPALAEALASGRLPEARLADEEADSALQLLVALRDYAWKRQRVLDEVLTDRLLGELYRRR